ncbi:hypothetical protein HMPREF0058_1118, partial [Actinomyces urogenitalis DSM 15434]
EEATEMRWRAGRGGGDHGLCARAGRRRLPPLPWPPQPQQRRDMADVTDLA